MKSLPSNFLRTLCALATLLVGTGVAHAHGGPPITRVLAFHPTARDTLVMQTAFGLVRTEDGGDTWRWMCPQVMEWDVGEDPPFVVMGDGSVLGALFNGVTRGEPDLCGWGFPEPALETVAIDLTRDPTDDRHALALTSAGGVENGLWETRDAGRTWTLAAALGNVLWERVRFAPSDPSRVYVSGGNPPRGDPSTPDFEPRSAWVWRSNDGGRTFDEADRRPVDLRDEDRAVQLLAVDPADPDTLFLRVQARDADDLLRRSTDGGETWETLRSLFTLYGFTTSADGQTLWVSGLDSGVARSTDGGDTWDVLDADLDSRCLEWRDDGLYFCGRFPVQAYGLARSASGALDDAEILFQPARLRGMVECAEGGQVDTVCTAWLPDLCADVQITADWCYAGLPDAGPSSPVDGGTARDAGDGGGCALAERGPAGGGAILAGVLGLWLLSGRRRRVTLGR